MHRILLRALRLTVLDARHDRFTIEFKVPASSLYIFYIAMEWGKRLLLLALTIVTLRTFVTSREAS